MLQKKRKQQNSRQERHQTMRHPETRRMEAKQMELHRTKTQQKQGSEVQTKIRKLPEIQKTAVQKITAQITKAT